MKKAGKTALTVNKKAGFNYEILDKFEAGIRLTGSEVKAAKQGLINLSGSYASLEYDEKQNPRVVLKNCKISRYDKAGYGQDKYNPLRDREILLNKREIVSLVGKMGTKGLTLVPFSVYTMRRLIKVELALVKGKSKVDKREKIKNRDIDRRLKQKLNY
jgi:SsrA-binding protein